MFEENIINLTLLFTSYHTLGLTLIDPRFNLKLFTQNIYILVFGYPKVRFYDCYLSFLILSSACLLAALAYLLKISLDFIKWWLRKLQVWGRGRVLLSSPSHKLYMPVLLYQVVRSLCLYWQNRLGCGHLGNRWMGKVAPLIIPVTPVLSIFSQYRELSHSFYENVNFQCENFFLF